MFCKAVIVAENSSSCDIFAISSCDMPNFSNASEPVSAAFASVFILALRVSIDVPECCITASHSWYASALIPIFCDILSILSP